MRYAVKSHRSASAPDTIVAVVAAKTNWNHLDKKKNGNIVSHKSHILRIKLHINGQSPDLNL